MVKDGDQQWINLTFLAWIITPKNIVDKNI